MYKDSFIKRFTQLERVNFLLTNRIPRRYATLFMGWFSRIENPLVSGLSLAIWKLFSDELNLAEAKKTQFKSLHDCFIRELKPGVRPINQNPQVIVSPCDAIVGGHGQIDGIELIQAKGFPYTLMDLLADNALVERYRDGIFVTLRLQSTMYHRFHAPYDCRITDVSYISGDTWNVNPIALKRVARLYCKNERAVIDLQLKNMTAKLTLVPVAAILVASIKLHCLDQVLNLKYPGPNKMTCDTSYNKGDELGYFHQGSTIIVFGTKEFSINENITDGSEIRMGQPLLMV